MGGGYTSVRRWPRTASFRAFCGCMNDLHRSRRPAQALVSGDGCTTARSQLDGRSLKRRFSLALRLVVARGREQTSHLGSIGLRSHIHSSYFLSPSLSLCLSVRDIHVTLTNRPQWPHRPTPTSPYLSGCKSPQPQPHLHPIIRDIAVYAL